MGGSLGVVVCWAVLVALSVGTVLTGASGLWGVVLGLAVVKGRGLLWISKSVMVQEDT